MQRLKMNNPLHRPLQPGGARTGSPRGPQRVSRTLKDAILYAAQLVGSDGRGTDGLVGYLVALATREPKTFGMLLGRVLPLHVKTEVNNEQVRFRSIAEVQAELKARGIPIDRIFMPAPSRLQ